MNDVWRMEKPEDQGIDSRKLAKALSFLEECCGPDGTRETVLVRNGAVVWTGDKPDSLHQVYSCTKSFTSTVLGLLVADGKCDLDTPAADILPRLAEKYPGLTLRHLVTMTSGYNAVGKTYDEDGSLDFTVPADPLFAPGTMYCYWDDPTNLLGHLLAMIAGRSMEEIFRERIADPIGMTRWAWGSFDPRDGLSCNGGSGNHSKGVSVTPSDMARFGLLHLRGGRWGDRRLLDPAWVAAATTVQVPVAPSITGR